MNPNKFSKAGKRLNQKFSFLEKRFIFVNSASEGEDGSRENLDDAEKAIYAILKSKEERSPYEEKVWVLLNKKISDPDNILEGQILRNYFDVLVKRVDDRERSKDAKKIHEVLSSEEKEFLREFENQIKYSGIDEDRIKYLYFSIIERNEKGYAIDNTILQVRKKLYSALTPEDKESDDSLGGQIKSVSDYFKDKNFLKSLREKTAEIPTEEEIKIRLTKHEKEIVKFCNKIFKGRSQVFIEYLNGFPETCTDSSFISEYKQSGKSGGILSFPWAFKKFFDEKDSEITNLISRSKINYNELRKTGDYKSLIKNREVFGNLANIKEAYELSREDKQRELREKTDKMKKAITGARKYLALNEVPKEEHKVNLEDPRINVFFKNKGLEAYLIGIIREQKRLTEERPVTIALTKIEALIQELSRADGLVDPNQRVKLAVEKEGLFASLSIDRVRGKIKDFFTKGLKRKIRTDKDDIEEEDPRGLSVLTKVSSWAKNLNTESDEYTNKSKIYKKEDLENMFARFSEKLEESDRSGMFKEILDYTKNHSETKTVINSIKTAFDESLIASSQEGEVNFDSDAFVSKMTSVIDALKDDSKEKSERIRAIDKDLDKSREAMAINSFKLKVLNELKEEFAISDSEKARIYFDNLDKSLSETDFVEGDSEEERLGKLSIMKSLLAESEGTFRKMGINLDDAFGDDPEAFVAEQMKKKDKQTENDREIFEKMRERAVKRSSEKLQGTLSSYKSPSFDESTSEQQELSENSLVSASPNQADIFDAFMALGKQSSPKANRLNKSYNKIQDSKGNVKLRFVSRAELNEKHSELLGKRNDVINTKDEQRTKVDSSSPFGITMPLDLSGNKHIIYVCDDFREVLEKRSIPSQNYDYELSDFLEEEIHHIRQDRNKDKFENFIDFIATHPETQDDWERIKRQWKSFYGYSDDVEVDDIMIAKEIDAQDAINKGRKYSAGYKVIDNLWTGKNGIKAKVKRISSGGIDFDFFKDADLRESQLANQLQSRAAANHAAGVRDHDSQDDDHGEGAQDGKESKADEKESPQEIRKKLLSELEDVLDDSHTKPSAHPIIPYYLNIHHLKERLGNLGDTGYDLANIEKAINDLNILKGRLVAENIDVEKASFFFKEIKEGFLEKLEKEISKNEAHATSNVSFLKEIWLNTKFMSVNMCLDVAVAGWEHLKEEHESWKHYKTALFGKDIGGSTSFGSKQRAKLQSAEQHKVHEWVESFKGLAEQDIQDLLVQCRDEFELKALMEYKASTIGDFYFEDKNLWGAIERSLGKRIYSARQAKDAVNKRYGDTFAFEMEDQARSKYRSKAESLKDLVRGQQNQMEEWMHMTHMVHEAHEQGKPVPWVDSMHFDAAFRYSLEDGKSTPQKAFYYLFKGYHMGILHDEAMNDICQSKQSIFPPIEQIPPLVEDHKKGKRFTPPKHIEHMMHSLGYHYKTEIDFIASLDPFKGGSQHEPDYLIWEWWMAGKRFGESKKASERFDKAFSRFVNKPDPDWGEEMIWHLSDRILHNALTKSAEASDKIATNGMANAYQVLIYYGVMLEDDTLEKMLRRFINVDRFLFEESYKKDGDEIKTNKLTGKPEALDGSKPAYWRDELNVRSVSARNEPLGAYRYSLFEAFKDYSNAGGGKKGIMEARKRMLEDGIALGVIDPSEGTESFISMAYHGHLDEVFKGAKANQSSRSAEILSAYKDMPLGHTLKDDEGRSLSQQMGANYRDYIDPL